MYLRLQIWRRFGYLALYGLGCYHGMKNHHVSLFIGEKIFWNKFQDQVKQTDVCPKGGIVSHKLPLRKPVFVLTFGLFWVVFKSQVPQIFPLEVSGKKPSLKGLSKKPLTREGEQPQLGDLPTMLINHLLNWMILQVVSHIFWFLPRSLGWFDPIWLSHIFQMGGKNPSTFS